MTNDLISRAEVLKLIYDYKENHSENRKEYPINYGTLIDMIRWVRNLPSVTPQEPFINKPCVSEKACEHDKQKVLDKIRAEIAQLPTTTCTETRRISIDADDFKENVLAIIDKYKAEIEPQESEE